MHVNVVETLGGVGARYGGPSVSVPQLCRAIARDESTSVTLLVPSEPGDPSANEVLGGYRFMTLPFRGPNRVRFTPGLVGAANGLFDVGVSVLHCHGLWMYPQWALGRLAIRRQVPLIVSPRGMLQGWALTQRGRAKRMLQVSLMRQHINQASLYHALSMQELKEIRAFGVRCPVAVIPNGIDVGPPPADEACRALRTRLPILGEGRICLFLSRLHPKKNLEGLLQAWGELAKDGLLDDWHLIVAGEGAPNYVHGLRGMASALGLAAQVSFVGGIYGEEKAALFWQASLYVLPSHSEGFSMAVLEAAAAGVPVVMTPECNFPELQESGGAVTTSSTPVALAGCLGELLQRSDASLLQMGSAGAALVQAKYSWHEIGKSMADVYRWILHGGVPPATVHE